jgi:hypothetical protein
VFPTWRGCLLFGLCFVIFAILAIRGIHPFLTVSQPVPGGVLVVEGWAPDYALVAAVEEFKQNHYEKVFVTGGPLERGAPLSEYKTYADLGAASLVKLGLAANVVQGVPAPLVRQDRTYTSAVTLRKWFGEHGMPPTQLNLITVGPHARRSRLLFQKAFGRNVTVGIMAIPENGYDERNWWHSSEGVRAVIGEALAYGYARIFFRVPRE